ncbi:plexin-B2b isoform X2 [Electrophorus electricus]|nr:plexin-B2b isoform X2 [Electrophorus electricus]XP_035391865.1 plexin-B2b isoform X2 [Electrophorus electricus]XP_035391868.1 plexin-B2b isoform X2 [Electrophorus electricus]XP_035391871.1 plexin-B2b isoform X2 [Electrophorus electricus]XP_035391873.1 plexin-B2b isoform X2 [Electrophorus electricus]XP_035391880.1 plexin-B2b isoform X2 [Electrophorus electricus]XP_035391884.1 plexin-B2b isoform X2 [Electrophorus electricus]
MAGWVLMVLLVVCVSSVSSEGSVLEFHTETCINSVVQDPLTGRVYLGAINAIYQLDAFLSLEAKAETGPKKDARSCTPPMSTCMSADLKDTDNINKLLLVHSANGSLIVCGSVYRGICSLLDLSDVSKQIYYSDNKGERTYAASIEENVPVVAVMATFQFKDTPEKKPFSVFLVAKGYGSQDNPKLITTRILENYKDWVVFENIVEASGVQTIPFVPKYQHQFRFAFKDSGFVYFLFSRTQDSSDNRNFSFVSRLCEQDEGYYSYTELQLNCTANGVQYSKVQAAYVTEPGKELARAMLNSGQFGTITVWDKVLFVVASPDGENATDSALCMYPLKRINERVADILKACYIQYGKIGGRTAVYTPYISSTNNPCTNRHSKEIVDQNRCGAEFLRSPLASKPEFALQAESVFNRQGRGHLTAVAIDVENDDTIAFLGNSLGEVLKVHLSSNPEVYNRVPGDTTGDRVNKNLFFDKTQSHLYITTEKKITKVPVQSCHQKTDCKSCVAQRDPYCGWCVLEGRCTRRSDCLRAEEKNAWLWSPKQQCVKIVSFHPPRLSCKRSQQVEINIPSLPSIRDFDRIHCMVGLYTSNATMVDSMVSCHLPPSEMLPPTPPNQDSVSVPLRIFVNGSVEVAARDYEFYNCAAAVHKAENTPCIACVSRPWACQWNTADHTCSDMSNAESGPNIIKHKQAKNCPRFENPDPTLIPVGYRTRINFEGVNLEAYKDREFTIGTELMKQFEDDVTTEETPFFYFSGYVFSYDKAQEMSVLFHIKDKYTEKKIDSTLNVTLYNCSLGREDCSLCKNAHLKYDCVWCARTRSCVFSKLCPTAEEEQDCPPPGITDIIPHYGPLNGGISVTIKGSNLGIQKDDIKSITVAGVPCVHQEEKYSVSTSVVCKIGPSSPRAGRVEVEVRGGRTGMSSVLFTYRDPKPEAVHPKKGPKAGGTIITITGTALDTASEEDINITVGGVSCPVEQFGKQITCKVGQYGAERVPSDPLPVTVMYGKQTVTQVPASFQFSANPEVADHQPKESFDCGGRKIVVTGSGFDLIQKASVRVQVSADEWSGLHTPLEFVQEAAGKNDTTLQFLSPSVSVNRTHEGLSFRTFIHLDNHIVELQPFEYHPDPTFNKLPSNVITENSMIIVTGRGFSKAMTAKEAQAFLGDVLCNVNTLQDDKLFLDPPTTTPRARSKRQRRDTTSELLDLLIKFGNGEWLVGSVHYERKYEVKLDTIIIPAVIVPMLLIIAISVVCYRRKSQQAEREYEKVKHQLENLEESVRDRCKKEFTDLMIEMEDHTNDLSEGRIPFLDYKTYTDRVFFLPSKDGANDVMITGKLDIPESRRATVAQALNQFSNLLNSKTFLITFIRTLEARPDFNARAKVYFASLLTVALHGKLEYYTDIMRTLLLGLMEEYVQSKNPKLMLRRSETVVERMLCNWMSICLYQFLKDTAGEPLYKLFRAIKHQIEKGPVDAQVKKAKYTLNDTGLLGDDVEYCMLTLQVLVQGEGHDVTPVKVLDCDTISQVKEKIIEQVYKNLPYSQRPKVESVTLEWRPGSTGQILSDLDVTSQKEGRWRRLNTLAHYNVRDNATLVLSRVLHTQQSYYQNHDNHEERNALLEDDKVFHLVRPAEELDEVKSKRGSIKDKSMTKAITEIYLTRLLSVKGTLQQFVDDFFRSVLCSGTIVPPAVKYFFDFLDEQALKHDNVDEETIHIWKTNSLPLRFWVNILKNPHFIFDVHVTEVVDASLSVIAQTFMDACTKSEHKLSRDSPSNKLLYAKEISTYKKMVDDYYKGIRQMVPVSDQDMNTHLTEVSRAYTDKLNTQVALHQLYQYASKYYKEVVLSLDEDPAAQSKQLTLRLQQIAAALENKVTDL